MQSQLLLTTSSDAKQSFPLQAFAQSTNSVITANTTSISTNNIPSLTFPGQTIVHRGIITSEESTHLSLSTGEKPHAAGISPLRKNGATYTGVLTFTATKPVEIGFGRRLHGDNSTLSQIDMDKLGSPVRPILHFDQLVYY